jgi:hypothetical protein
MSEWADQYKDIRWKNKREQIITRDDYTCCDCGLRGGVLNVHHAYYDNGRSPWKYPDDMLLTLCESCHKERHTIQKSICWMLGQIKGTQNIVDLKAAFDLLASGVYRRMLGQIKVQQDLDCSETGDK